MRGEVYLPRSAFERTNREREHAGDPVFANPRNAAAGTMRNLEPSLVAKRGLSAFVYQAIEPSSAAHSAVHSHAELLTAMREWGLPVEPHWRRCLNVDEVVAFARSGPRNGARSNSTPTASSSRWTIWRCANGSAPRRSFRAGPPPSSFPRSRRRRSCRIDVNVGRTGAVTPFAVLEPVLLAGSTISMATLHNAEDVARKDLREGDRVLIEKGGDVIPKVVKPILPHADGSATLAHADVVPGVRQCAPSRRGRSCLALRAIRRARHASAAVSSTSRHGPR